MKGKETKDQIKYVGIRFQWSNVSSPRPALSCFQHNWVSRRADQGPKTIEQIHKEAKIEEQEEQRKVHQQLLAKDSKRRPGQASARQILFRA